MMPYKWALIYLVDLEQLVSLVIQFERLVEGEELNGIKCFIIKTFFSFEGSTFRPLERGGTTIIALF